MALQGQQSPARNLRRQVRLGLLRAFGAVTRPFVPRAPLPEAAARILVIRPDHLGDALFTTPALRALRECYPSANITALVGPWSLPVYERLTSFDRVLACPFPGFGPQPRRSAMEPYAMLLAWARRVHDEGFDLAVNLRFDFWWGAMLAQAARIPSRLGYSIPECRPFLTRAVAYERGRHEAAQNLALVAELVEPDPARRAVWLRERLATARLEFPLREGEQAAAARLLAGIDGGGRGFVAIHPGTRGLAKLWQPEGWATVADALAARTGAWILLTGSADEKELCLRVKAKMQAPVTVLAGNTSLGELVALFAGCSLVLGVDSGPLHLAVAAGVPTVHLYGPSDHVAFAPFGDPRRHVTVRSGIECSPCHKFDWPLAEMVDHPCMRAITPETVLNAAEQALDSGVGDPAHLDAGI